MVSRGTVFPFSLILLFFVASRENCEALIGRSAEEGTLPTTLHAGYINAARLPDEVLFRWPPKESHVTTFFKLNYFRKFCGNNTKETNYVYLKLSNITQTLEIVQM